ncbi:MAG: HU family DNA-binding protein [Gammaproteobacteria bacterium]|nr:HU family DNA-binding protein [Gammaproteobacteria bacterium]
MAKSKTIKPAKKTAAPAPAKKKSSVSEAFTKSQVLNFLAENAGIKKKDVTNVMSALADLMEMHLGNKRGPGEFVVPGLMKCRVVRKPATKARKGINPFTKEETVFQAKPARNIVKIRPLKKLKDMVE